jgi:putative endonuclease
MFARIATRTGVQLPSPPAPESFRGCRAVASAKGPVHGTHLLRATARQASWKMRGFSYVCVLQSESNPAHFYTGCTGDLRERLTRHNSGKVPYTAKWKPWRIKTYVAFSDSNRAEFERYLKCAPGRAFVKSAFDQFARSAADSEGYRNHFAPIFSHSLQSLGWPFGLARA